MLDHDFDGIRELDNRVPPWFSWLFYVTIIFAVIYLLNYHVFQASPLQDEEYQMQVKEAEAQRTALVKSGAFLNCKKLSHFLPILHRWMPVNKFLQQTVLPATLPMEVD
jgi:hypothetical protein